MLDIFYLLNLWNWVLAGFILLLLELVIPGVFLVWFGLAAVVTAAIAAIFGSVIPVLDTWQAQVAIFLVFSILFVVITRNIFRREQANDVPFLNRRTDEMIGHIAMLSEPIKDGQGHVRIGDSLWRITGPDTPKGTRVRLTNFVNGAFQTEIIDCD